MYTNRYWNIWLVLAISKFIWQSNCRNRGRQWGTTYLSSGFGLAYWTRPSLSMCVFCCKSFGYPKRQTRASFLQRSQYRRGWSESGGCRFMIRCGCLECIIYLSTNALSFAFSGRWAETILSISEGILQSALYLIKMCAWGSLLAFGIQLHRFDTPVCPQLETLYEVFVVVSTFFDERLYKQWQEYQCNVDRQ